MDLETVRQQVTARVQAHDDEDVADGSVVLSAPDDGFTSPGAKATTVGTAATDREAVDLVGREVEESVAHLREQQASAAPYARPAEQPAVTDDELREACTLWQGGRDVGSSPVRGAARALTGVAHYFRAPFITEYEKSARTSPEVLRAGVTLLRAVNAAQHLDADGWNAGVDLPPHGFAGRGIRSKPDEDPQIEKQLGTGQIEMPLWGVSLSREVADGFGTRFLFELVGEFPAVPAWQASGIKDHEQELVTGGRYRVVSREQVGETTHVRLRWIGASGDRVGSDELLLQVLGALPGLWHSKVTRSAGVGGEDVLTVRLEGRDNWATVSRTPGSGHVTVVRYWEPEPGWDARGDDPYAEDAAIRKASWTTTVPADVEAVVAAVLKGKENG